MQLTSAALLMLVQVVVASTTAPLRQRIDPSPTDSVLVTHGDSITRDQGRFNYTVLVQASMISAGLNPAVLERGINGISYNYHWAGEPYQETLIEDAALVVDPFRVPGVSNWLIVFAGTNGMALGGHSAATEYSNFKTYVAARIASGWLPANIVVATMLPRSGFTDSIRQTFNASLVGDDGGYGYRLARLDLNADIGAPGANLNPTYFYDGIHPTIAGQSIIAGIVYGAMFP